MSFLQELDNMSTLNSLHRRQESVNPLDWTVATVADVGTSLWNSVTFGQANVSTASLLGALGADGALKAYNTHRDSIELASFVGGVMIPGMAAIKLTKAVREGNKAFYALSSNRRKEDLTRMKTLIEEGKRGQSEYRKVRNSTILKAQANNMMDTVAAELAIMGTMNAHPFMEDYMADPVKNFGIGLVIGGGITAPFAAIGSRTAIKAVNASVESASAKAIEEAGQLFNMPAADASSALNAMTRAADDIEHYVSQPAVNAFTREQGLDMAASIRAAAGNLAKQKLPEGLDTTQANWLKDLLASPQFLGSESVKFYQPPKGGILTKVKEAVVPRSEKPTFVQNVVDAEGNPAQIFDGRHFYSADLGGSFIPEEHVHNLASAADAHTAKTISKRASTFQDKELFGKYDELMLKSSADVEAEYLARMLFYEGLPTEKLIGASIVGDDLPAIHGWFQAVERRSAKIQDTMSKLDPLDPDHATALAKLTDELASLEGAKLSIHSGDQMKLVRIEEIGTPEAVASGLPSTEEARNFLGEMRQRFNDVEGNILPIIHSGDGSIVAPGTAISKEIASSLNYKHGNLDSFQRVGSRTYYEKLIELADSSKTINSKLEKLFPADYPTADLSTRAKTMLALWVGGSEGEKILIRSGLESARTLRKGSYSHTPFHDEWTEILNHPYVKSQQEAIKEMADSNGNIVLYRGTHNAPSGQSSFASYSHSRTSAEDFGDVRVYSIHADDVLGFLTTTENEFIVGASTLPHRDADEIVTATTKPKVTKEPPVEFSPDDALQHYLEKTLDGLKQATKDGLPIEVAALRHNMTTDQAMAFLANDRNLIKKITGDLFSINFDFTLDSAASVAQRAEKLSLISRWQSSGDIPAALDYRRRIVEVSAKERHHLGTAGEVLQRQRNLLEEHHGVSEQIRSLKRSLNEGDNLAAEHLRAKAAVYGHLYAGIQQEWINLTMTTSESVLAKELMFKVVTSDMTNLIRANLDQVVNSKGGNPLYLSADMVMRNMEGIGPVVAALGDQRNTVVNNAIKRFVEPIANSFKQLGKDPAARTEFAMLDQFRQATKGPMVWDSQAGRFALDMGKDVDTGETIWKHVGPPATIQATRNAMDAIEVAGRELYAARATKARLGNGNAPQDIGTWIPSNHLFGKEYAYIQDLETRAHKILVADSFEDLQELKQLYKLGPHEKLISRTRAELENIAMLEDGRIQAITMADVDKTKRGIGVAAPDISNSRLEDIAKGYMAQFNRQATGLMEEAMHDIITKLDHASAIGAQAVTDSKKAGWRKAVAQLQHKDTAADVKDYLLGRNPVHRSELMRTVNQVADTVISYAAKTAVNAWEIVRPERLGDPVDYEKYLQTLAAQGVPNPFHAFAVDEQAALFAKAKKAGYPNDPQRVVNAFNALAATTALKFLEIAQPIINIMSTPILMSSAISRMADLKNLDGAGLLANSQMAIMMNGVRRMNSKLPVNKRLFEMAKEEGLLTATISEVEESLRLARLGQDLGGITKLERVLNHDLVNILSKPAEMGEEITRKVIFGTGVELAYRQLGAGASDKQVMIFARNFMKQANGNYSAAQRPAMFQGSFGSAMGLFQTYMLTYAQNMYSHIERADRAGLVKMMLFQGGIFGTYSLPGFNAVSEAIGANFSDEHYDLKTGLYRALPDKLSNALIYGMPSNLVGALHTRGDVSPRIPSGFHEFVAPSMVLQYADTVVNLAKAASRFDEGAGSAMLEALSIQSTSRPIARLAELANGYSVTAAGKMVAGSEEVWSFQGIMSRILSTRTLAEAQAREVMHLNTVYGQKDRYFRQDVMKKIRQDLRNNRLTNERLDHYANEYLRTGSPQGFRAAVNEAWLANENKGIIDLSDTLKDSPLSLVLDDIDL